MDQLLTFMPLVLLLFFWIGVPLLGKLPTGEEVKVSIGSGVGFRCNVFVNQDLIFKK